MVKSMEIKLIKLAVFLALLAAILTEASGQSTYIPYELGGDNYYTMQGGPDLSASISGTDEFERGDTVTLYMDLTNYGRILGFKEDQTPQNPKEYALAASELQKEYSKPTALGITANLVSEDQQIEIKSGDQVVESLKSGDKTKEPLEFTIKIGEHAPAGEYPLKLNLSYDYQDNVRVYATKLLTEGGGQSLVNYRESYVYQKANQSVPILVMVKREADFQIINASGTLSAGSKKGDVSATYRNIGEDPIRDAVARLSIFKPFSSTDDQAFIGSMQPGEEKSVQFKIDVDSDATAKEYGINSEIKYTDVYGDTVISESMKIPVTIEEASSSMMLPAIILLVIVAAAGGYWYKKKKKA